MGNANGADWQKEVYQKIKSMKEMYLSELKYIYLKIASKVRQVPNDPLKLNLFYTYKTLVIYLRSEIEMNGNNWMAAQARGGGEGAGAAAGDWRIGLVPYTRQRIVNKILEDIQRVFPVFRHRHVQELGEIAVMFEEKMYNVATSWNDYLYRISFKLRTMTNCFHINTASSGQNAHGPGMTMEATSYETTSGPEDSDKETAEEDDEGVFKEDVVEKVVGTKEQNYVVGHKDNVRVVENEESSSSKVIGRPSVFFK